MEIQPGVQTEMREYGGHKRRSTKLDKDPSNGWVDTDPLQAEDVVPDVTLPDPGKPWPREYSLVLGQLMVSLIVIMVGTMLFAGYVIGIASGCICWVAGLIGIMQNTRHGKAGLLICASSGGRASEKYEMKFHACSQLVIYAVGAFGLFALGVTQSYLSHVVDGSGSCTVRLYESQGFPNSTMMASLNGTRLDIECKDPKSGALKAYAETVGCAGGCICVDKHHDPVSGSKHTCKHACYASSVLKDNVCGASLRQVVAGEGSLIAGLIVGIGAVLTLLRVLNLGIVELNELSGPSTRDSESKRDASTRNSEIERDANPLINQ